MSGFFRLWPATYRCKTFEKILYQSMKLLASLKTTNIICNNLPAAAKRHQTLEFLRETFN